MKFIWKHGRIIPIREDGDSRKAVAASGVAGAVVAADAARTTRVYATKNYTIDKKKFAFQPFSGARLGDHLVLRKRDGAKVGQARFYFTRKDKTASFSWLSVRKDMRGKGLSQLLSKQAAIEMKEGGAKSVFNHVVHPGSLLTHFNTKRDTLWKEVRTLKDGSASLEAVTKKAALRSVNRWMQVSSKMSRLDGWLGKEVKGAKGIFRETKIPRALARHMKPFRTPSNKLNLAVGLGVAAGSALYLGATRRKKEPKNVGD